MTIELLESQIELAERENQNMRSMLKTLRCYSNVTLAYCHFTTEQQRLWNQIAERDPLCIYEGEGKP